MISPGTPDETLSPSDLNRRARTLLESHFDFVWVEGELSNLARPSSGHWYFTLKDSKAQVRCAMFRNANQRLRFKPANGDQVRLRARVSLYEGRGEFQLIGEYMEPVGAGALQARFEAIRDKLQSEGLFAQERKQPLPTAVRHIAVITSPTGAALQDILQVLDRRNPSILVSVLPVAVQGENAAKQLRLAVERANRLALARKDCDFDAVLIARGGGSLEDLWAFNDEELARAIVASALPVVSGVGHEVDVTIADFAADMRAPTPSAGAELLSEDRVELVARVAYQQRQLTQQMAQRLNALMLRLDGLRSRLRHPGDRLREQSQRLDNLEIMLRRGIQQSLSDAQSGLEQRQRLLHSLNPLAILDRGYALIQRSDGEVLKSSKTVVAGESLRARLNSGEITVEVTEIFEAREGGAGESGAGEGGAGEGGAGKGGAGKGGAGKV